MAFSAHFKAVGLVASNSSSYQAVVAGLAAPRHLQPLTSCWRAMTMQGMCCHRRRKTFMPNLLLPISNLLATSISNAGRNSSMQSSSPKALRPQYVVTSRSTTLVVGLITDEAAACAGSLPSGAAGPALLGETFHGFRS